MIRIILLLLLSTTALGATAQDDKQLWDAIEKLKMRIERLESEAGLADGQKKTAVAEKIRSNTSAMVFTRYWLSKNAAFDGRSEAPLREGLMSLDSMIKLKPELYGYKSSGLFDERTDPSIFPVAAVSIEGVLMIENSGLYQLIIKPTPPREVGGAGNVEVSVEVSIGGEKLFIMPFSKSLASQQKEISITAGRQPLLVKILARSPGFGPSPTRTEVYIGLQTAGEIAPLPIMSYLAGGG